jgi:xanthine dehydrogenase YagR molybdenum-binding subunit
MDVDFAWATLAVGDGQMSRYIGQDLPRVDGPQKVTGSARYSGEISLPGLAYAEIVGATIASGRIKSIDVSAAVKAAGVAAVLTRRDMPVMNHVKQDLSLFGGPAAGQTFFPMQDDVIYYAGQPVAIAVADSLEEAQHAATLVGVEYAETLPVTGIDQGRGDAYEPDGTRTTRGDARAGLAAAEARVDAEFRFAANHHNALEALTTTAVWDGDELTLYDSCQGIKAVQLTVAALLGLSPSKIRVLASYIGGAFGSKARVWPHVTLAAVAARQTRRPVRFTASREQMFTSCGHREEQEQRIELGADSDGKLTAIRHSKISVTSPFDDYAEPAFLVASKLYASPAYEGILHLVRGNTMTPTSTRAPGAAAGSFALECAMDELACELGIDPVELRLRNLTAVDPNSGNPWSSWGLRECLLRGAERIGWDRRDPRQGSERDGNWLIGTGMATAAYTVSFAMRTQRARAHLYADGTAAVQTSTQEFGTGLPTALTQVAADALGVRMRDVRLEFGDTSLAASGSPVGSNGAMMVSSAVHNAGIAVRDQLIALAVADPRSPLHDADPADIIAADGRLMLAADAGTGETFACLMGRHRMNDADAIGSWTPPPPDTPYGLLTFGAQFARVAVDADLGIARVRHMAGAFAPGRVLNPRTTRSQLMGGMLWGLSQALLEGNRLDARSGRWGCSSLGDYLVPVNADAPDIDVDLIELDDPVTGPLGVKGVGEIGLVGAGAAIANAIYHATGYRAREVPITIENVLKHQSRRLFFQRQRGRPLGNGEHGGVGGARDDRTHDGGVSDPETADAVNTQAGIDHGVVVRADTAGTDGVVVGGQAAANVLPRVSLARHGIAGSDSAAAPVVQGAGLPQFPGSLQADHLSVEVAPVAQVVRVDERRDTGVGAGQAKRSPAGGCQQGEDDGVPVLCSGPPAWMQGKVEEKNLQIWLIRKSAAETNGGLAEECLTDRPRGRVGDRCQRMVVQVLTDAREVCLHRDADVPQMLGRAHPRHHQQLRRPDGAGREDDLTFRVDRAFLAVLAVDDPLALPPVDDQPASHRAGDHREVATVEDRAQIGVGGRLAPALDDVCLAPPGPFSVRAVVVIHIRMACFERGRHERVE